MTPHLNETGKVGASLPNIAPQAEASLPKIAPQVEASLPKTAPPLNETRKIQQSLLQDYHDVFRYNLGSNVTSETLSLHHHYFLQRTSLGKVEDEMKMFSYFIQYHIPFAVTRYGDGEYDIIKGIQVGRDEQANYRDGWYWESDRVGILGDDLIATLVAPSGLFFYGFSKHDYFKYQTNELKRIGGYTVLPYF